MKQNDPFSLIQHRTLGTIHSVVSSKQKPNINTIILYHDFKSRRLTLSPKIYITKVIVYGVDVACEAQAYIINNLSIHYMDIARDLQNYVNDSSLPTNSLTPHHRKNGRHFLNLKFH